MDERRLRELLAACSGKRVLVVGDVMLGESLWGAVRRISPEAPVPLVEVQGRWHLGLGQNRGGDQREVSIFFRAFFRAPEQWVWVGLELGIDQV